MNIVYHQTLKLECGYVKGFYLFHSVPTTIRRVRNRISIQTRRNVFDEIKIL